MSVCLETANVLTTTVGTAQATSLNNATAAAALPNEPIDGQEKPSVVAKNVAKIIVANPQAAVVSGAPSQMKIVSSPLITVMNTTGPITVMKSSLGSNSASHILVNSTPLTVKTPQTITLVNASPITVVKAIPSVATPQSLEQHKGDVAGVNNGNLMALGSEKTTLHNVFVKKPVPVADQDIPQSHKLLTANPFPSTNVIQTAGPTPLLKTVNGQKPVTGNKVKILSNVVMPNTIAGPSTMTLNKANQRIFHQKNIGNGMSRYLPKPMNNIPKQSNIPKNQQDKTQKIIYAGTKSQIKTLSALTSFSNKPQNVKALSPQAKPPLGQMQKPGPSRPMPPKAQQKMPGKPNYIGKHAVQAQKLKQPMPKKVRSNPFPQYQNRPNQVTFNQALTAQILETLGSKSSSYEPTRYEPQYSYQEPEPRPVVEYQPQSNLDTLSFVCQAVLLDHNYNATLPMDSPVAPSSSSTQMNGVSNISCLYSPPGGSKRRLNLNLTPSNTLSSLSTSSLVPSTVSQDDDAASDISCPSERKPESEGEETDTSPEAEAVSKEEQFDRYGDYVTRCICGFIHDDGYMIECDQCKVWQHVRCVVRTKKVPEDYLCEVCDPSKPTDRQKARALQQQWMREVQERDAKLVKEQLKQPLTDTDSSDAEHPSNNNISLASKGRRKPDLKQRQRREREKRQLKRKIPKRKMRSQSKTSDDEKSHVPQLRQWIDNYEEAVTNHYSPELRARMSNIRINGAHSELIGHVEPQLQKCKLHANSNGVKCLLSTVHLSLGTPIIELRGKYMLSNQHRTSTHLSNLTTRQQRPGPFLFFYRLHRDNTEVCVDTRTYGNIARFIRRSCQPNAELRHCIEKGVLHLYIVAATLVDKNVELTIKHESHDLAAASGSTEISCACGNPETCALNKSRKNGDIFDTAIVHRKRRGRRTSSMSEAPTTPVVKIKEEPPTEIEEEKKVVEIKVEEPVIEEIKKEVIEEEIKVEEVEKEEKVEVKVEVEVKEEEATPPPPPQVSTRRASLHHKSDHEDSKDKDKDSPQSEDKKKLSREERKMLAIVKAIERMEKQEQRKQEHQAKQAHRRESEPGLGKDDEKVSSRGKRRKRKGRTRTLSTNSQGRRNRLNSADSAHATSSDETMLSPNDQAIDQSSPRKAAGLLLAFSNGDNEPKSPERARDTDSNSNSSPETPLSSACLLVAAAVEPLEPGFKFPKTKKGLMNEWLNKGTESVSPLTSLTPTEPTGYDSGFYTPNKSLVALAQAATFCDNNTQHGNAKKRWLRQAISEDQCDSPNSRPESPPAVEMVAPPKKRRLPRESLSTETDTSLLQKGEEDASQEAMIESENAMSDFADVTDVKNTFKSMILESQEFTRKEFGSALDPRLSRDRALFGNSEHLVGTVEKTLSFLGFEEKKPETITPAKRKLSITEYRQRKKLNTNDKQEEGGMMEESTASQSPKPTRNRSNSSSSTSCPTSDEEISPVDLPPPKVLSAFNSEPTELERQRESVSLRLKKALGLTIDDDARKPAINVETILKCDLPTPPKTSLPLPSPTFPIPGSCEVTMESPPPAPVSALLHCETYSAEPTTPVLLPTPEIREDAMEIVAGDSEKSSEPVLYYTPDEDESEAASVTEEKMDTTSYVPPFNNPLYPNSNYTNYGSVIDDDAPYEGRNPSPPPNLGDMH